MIKLLLTTLTLFAPFVPLTQVNDDFDIFQTVEKYQEDFDYLVEKRISFAFNTNPPLYDCDYENGIFYYYALPLNYDSTIFLNTALNIIYSNSSYNFYNASFNGMENAIIFEISNYIGTQEEMPFVAFTSVGMSQIIEHDKDLPIKDNTLYGSFFAFFTGFFPHSVVAEYNGIFIAIVVAFLLFLVFGFIFFLFRTIRRLMGFR